MNRDKLIETLAFLFFSYFSHCKVQATLSEGER